MTRLLFVGLCFVLSFTNVKAQACASLGGSCLDPANSCCGGELNPAAGLCPGVGNIGQSCCMPEVPCEEDGNFCIPAAFHECQASQLRMGFCPGRKVCCTEDHRRFGGAGRGPAPEICSVQAQKDACNIIADPLINLLTGPELVFYGFTTVGNDGSSPYDNVMDTCIGYEIQTTTNPQLCNSYRTCLHEGVLRFMRCYRRLCGEYWVLNIASDSNGPGWVQHCYGRAVDIVVPQACVGMQLEQEQLCVSLDGTPVYYAGGLGGADVMHCEFTS